MKIFYCMLAVLFMACKSENEPVDPKPKPEPPVSVDPVNTEAERGVYLEKFDPIADVGQYTFPEMKVKPEKYWTCVNALVGEKNALGKTGEGEGLQNHLLCQSISGLTNRAVDEGKSKIAVWLYDHAGRSSYQLSLQALQNMGVSEQGMQTGVELARNYYSPADGIDIQVRHLFDGYVLTDVEHNPESATVASVASHVYNSIIVDVRDKEKYDQAGYNMTYDARNKTTRQSWNEFKNSCSKKALVVMPVQTADQRDFAIKNNLFVLNINCAYANPGAGQNLDILEEALAWLEPGAPVFGWEQGMSEDVWVNRASKMGHPWITADWCYNFPLTSLQYTSRQTQALAKVQHPGTIDYSAKKNFVAYWLTDGDNIDWMMDFFVRDYYLNPDAEAMKMGFGLPVVNLSMVSPPLFADILNRQKDSYTLIEQLGGGYIYVDNYAINNNRTENLEKLARSVAAHMRQHRIKVLGMIAQDVFSSEAIRGFKAFVDANDMLEGIVVTQYTPYAYGQGNIFWIKNQNGFDIPVITVKYSLWNFGNTNTAWEGTPAYVAGKLKAEAGDISFSLIAVHAWSNFKDTGNANDVLAENQGGNKNGASAAKLCAGHLDNRFETVSVQELIWRIRMLYKESQTKQYLEVVN